MSAERIKRFYVAAVQEIIYTSKMFSHLAAAKLIYFSDKSVKKLTVMAYDDGSTVKCQYRFFKNIF